MVRIVDESDFKDPTVIRPLLPIMDACGFHLIFTSVALRTYIRDKELTFEEVWEKDDGFLQRNSIYFFCRSSQRETTLKDTFIGKLLQKKLDDSRPPYEIILQLEPGEERDYHELALQVRKDLIFRDSYSKEEVGWYNIRANILWLPDLVHNTTRVVKLLQPVFEAIKDFRANGKLKGQKKFTIGADPEFEVVDEDNKLIPAHDLWPQQGEIGCDGHTSTGELRPQYTDAPLALVRNIKRLMRRVANHPKIPSTAKIQAGGGTQVTTGGHIHFSVKKLSPAMKDALHRLIGDAVIPHMTGPRVNALNTINKDGNDCVREKDYGLEWRPLPSWLVSEEMTTGIIVVSYCIIKDCLAGTFKNKTDEEKEETLRKLSLYPVYKPYIERFIEMFYHTTKKLKMEGVDVIPNWGIKRTDRVFNVQIVSRFNDITAFFSPIAVKLARVVRMRVDYGGDRLHVEGIPESLQGKWQDFAEDHFVDIQIKKTVEVADKYANERRPKGYISAVIVIPQLWERAKNKKRLFRKLRDLIQETAIKLGGNS